MLKLLFGRAPALVAILGFIALIISGCSDSGSELPKKITAPREVAELKVNDLDGNPLRLADHKGKVLLVDFWATWCPPCRDSIPHLVETHKRYKDRGFEIIGVSLDTDLEKLKKYMSKNGIEYPMAVGNQETKNDFGVSSIPRLFVVDQEGKIRGDFLGFDKSISKEIDAKVESLLGK